MSIFPVCNDDDSSPQSHRARRIYWLAAIALYRAWPRYDLGNSSVSGRNQRKRANDMVFDSSLLPNENFT